MSSTLMPTPDRRRPELLARLPELRARLERHRQYLVEQLTALDAPGAGRPARPGDPEHQIDLFMADATRVALGDVEVALHRIATGRYGTCLYCGRELPLGRLLAVPELDACAECARELEPET